MKKTSLLACFIFLFTASAGAENLTSLDDQVSVGVTIYNDNLALVKDKRKVSLPSGESWLAFRGVSGKMRPETALFRSVTYPGQLMVLEQNFDFDLLTPQTLLEKYLGQEIEVVQVNPATGVEKKEKATVLSTNNGLVLKIGDRIETGAFDRYIFKNVPPQLRDQPTLSLNIANNAASEQEVELSYLTGGLSWRADYVAELNPDDNELDLRGWVTLTNNSGASYNNASMQLLAGDVNRAEPESFMDKKQLGRAMPLMESAPAMEEESLFEYHLYTLARPTTIKDKQKKQVSLLSASSLEVQKEFILPGSSYYYHNRHGMIGKKIKVSVYVQFANEKEKGLGIPLPKGVVRVYKRDKKGRLQFVGEDRIDHTPNKEIVKLKLGEAFDVTANKKQTDFKKIARGMGGYITESEYEIELKNGKESPVTVIVREPIPGDWEILQENHKHSKEDAFSAQWQITVPAEGSETLKYRVKTEC